MDAHRVCATCTGCELSDPIRCESIDCPWLYTRKRAENKTEGLEMIEDLLDDLGSSASDTPCNPEEELDEDWGYQTPQKSHSIMNPGGYDYKGTGSGQTLWYAPGTA